jgi:putative membrane protein
MDMWQMMSQMMGAWGLGVTWLNFLTGITFLAMLIVGVVAGVRWLLAQESRGHGGETALDILKRRYARGDLTKEEFEVRKRDIA